MPLSAPDPDPDPGWVVLVVDEYRNSIDVYGPVAHARALRIADEIGELCAEHGTADVITVLAPIRPPRP